MLVLAWRRFVAASKELPVRVSAVVLMVGVLSGSLVSAAEPAEIRREPLPLQVQQPVQDLSVLGPGLREWVESEGQRRARSEAEPHPDELRAAVRERLQGQSFSDVDVEALVQLVLVQCAAQAEADLRDLTAAMQAQKERRGSARQPDNAITPTARSVQPVQRVDRESLQQLKLQQAMDRREKALEVLANLLKKQSDTSMSAIQNLK